MILESNRFQRPQLHFMFLLLNTGGQTSITDLKVLFNTLFVLIFRYYKTSDPGMWVNVDKNTGELRVANTIDRESDLVHDGIYNITVRAVDPSKLHAPSALFIKSFRKTASRQA